MQEVLKERNSASLYRSLQVPDGLIDFCSNDYLSFARNPCTGDARQLNSGSTGSRSISGNSAFAEQLEREIAEFHHAEAALLFNSGYDANLGLFSCLPSRGDTLITDELIHASIIDGCRLSYANRLRFAHNDTRELEKKLRLATGTVFVAVESVYSMDGDMAPLAEIADLCIAYGAQLIVDEAHATGVFGTQGRGLVNACGLEDKIFARVHTFGKALGCHGAAVVGSDLLRNYLINFARSFIFTTALPPQSLLAIQAAYTRLREEKIDRAYLHDLIRSFRESFVPGAGMELLKSMSPIQSVVIPGAQRAKEIAAGLQSGGFDVRAITPPSVAAGKERLRISLHLHNTPEEISRLLCVFQGMQGSRDDAGPGCPAGHRY